MLTYRYISMIFDKKTLSLLSFCMNYILYINLHSEIFGVKNHINFTNSTN